MSSRNQRRRSQQKRPQPQPTSEVRLIVEEKVNPAYAGVSLFSDAPQPHMMPKNYLTYAREGYKGNPTLFKCINYIITNGAAIPPKLYTDDTRQTEIKSHALLDKLKRPNPEKSGVQFRKAVMGYLLVAGNSYIYAIRKGIAGPPDELWPMQPDKIKILPTATRGIVGYEYDDFKGTDKNPILAANMLHLMTWNPDDPLFGLSGIEVGALMVDQVTAAQKWNLALLQNGARMSGAFTTPIILEPNARSKLEDKVNEKMAGYRNAGKIAVLDGGLQWNQIGAPPSEMDWLQALQYWGGSLANLYNMPPQLIGDTSSTTYDNMEQAKAASYTEEIFPILDEMYAEFTMWLVPMYPDLPATATLYYDKDSVEVVQSVIQQQKTAKAQRANTAWMQGSMMLDEARELQGLPPLPSKMGQVFRFGAVIVRASEMDDYADQSLKTPAAPPAPVPEQLLNAPAPGSTPPPTTPPLQGNDTKPGEEDNGKQPPPDASGDTDSTPGKSRNIPAHFGYRYDSKAKNDDEEEQTGAMVAFFLDPKIAKQVAIPDGESPDDLHITLAFLGDASELDIDVSTLRKTLASYASEAIPLQGSISGIGRFAAQDGESPVYASVNIAGLQQWRADLVKQLEGADIDVDKTFDFTPHITLDYIDADAAMPAIDVPDVALSFDMLWLCIGDKRYSFSIGDEQYPQKRRRFVATKALDLTTKEEKQAYLEQVEAARHTWEATISGRLQGYFKSEQQSVVAAIKHGTPTATDEDHLLNQAKAAIDKHKSKLQSIIATAWQDVAGYFAKQVDQELQQAKAQPTHQHKGVDFFSTQIIQYILALANHKALGINETIQNMIRVALANGIEAGESLPQLAARIENLYDNSIVPNRPAVIAATEVCSASNYGSMQSAMQSGLTLNKVWQATPDNHTRPAHVAADGQSVPMNTPFSVGGENLSYPGDPNGSENMVVNCRCAMYYQRVASTASTDDSSSDDGSGDEEKRRKRLEYKRFMEVLV